MVSQLTMFDGIWSRKISHSARPRNRSRRRSRPAGTTGGIELVPCAACAGDIASSILRTCGRIENVPDAAVARGIRRSKNCAPSRLWGFTMYQAVTRDIEVTVTPKFLPERSSQEKSYFFWAYTIEISNRGK